MRLELFFPVSSEENSKQYPSERGLKERNNDSSSFYKENKEVSEWGFPGGSVVNRLLCNAGDTS